MEMPLQIERVDITRDDALFTRYAVRIPVLECADQEIDAAGMDDASLRRWLSGLAP